MSLCGLDVIRKINKCYEKFLKDNPINGRYSRYSYVLDNLIISVKTSLCESINENENMQTASSVSNDIETTGNSQKPI